MKPCLASSYAALMVLVLAVPPPVAYADAVGQWVRSSPGAAIGASSAWDPVHRRQYVFGGQHDAGLSSDVVTIEPGDPPVVRLLVTAGPKPRPRTGALVVYDSNRNRLVVFGGRDLLGPLLADVWTLALDGTPTWTELAPDSTGPEGRFGASGVYEPSSDALVLFGGDRGGPTFADAWKLLFAGSPTWHPLATSGDSPSGRAYAPAILDPVRHRMVIHGGYTSGSAELADTRNWSLALDGAPVWTRLADGGPVDEAASQVAAYDARRDRMLVVAGGLYTAASVWAWPLSGASSWSVVPASGTASRPQISSRHVAACDSTSDTVMEWNGGFDARVYSLALADPPTWTGAVPGAAFPGEHPNGSVAFDPVGPRVLMMGGRSDAGGQDVLAFPPLEPAMALLANPLPPSATRRNQSTIVDPVRRRLICFGGNRSPSPPQTWWNDVWTLPLEGGDWAPLATSGTAPDPREQCAAIYDPVRDRMLVFGGLASTSLDDVWALTLGETPTWSALTPSGTPPSPRYATTAAYDALRDRVLFFGGIAAGAGPSETWALTLAGTPAWSPLTTSGAPTTVTIGSPAAYDALRDRLVVWDGTIGVNWTPVVRTLDLSNPVAWSTFSPPGDSTTPQIRMYGVADPEHDAMVFVNSYGGIFSLRWGEAPTVELSCPGDTTWTPGATMTIPCTISNPYAFAQTADWIATSARAWAGTPVSGQVTVGAGGIASFAVPIAVPDTVSAGLGRLAIDVTLRSVSRAVSRSVALHDAATAVQVTLVRADAVASGVRLAWQVSSGAGTNGIVERQAGTEGWIEIASLRADAGGVLVLDDADVRPGARYGYRLRLPAMSSVPFAETWIEVPVRPAFGLLGASPNPSGADAQVELSLPDATPARLELLDVGGRRVAVREVGVLGGGRHVVALGAGAPIAPGVYFARLTRESRHAEARIVVVR